MVYIYAITSDNGFALCIDNNWFTLSCCKGGTKGGMRKSVANEIAIGNNVYLLGLCGKSLAKTNEMTYRPIYFAKIDDIIPMIEYYAEGGQSAGWKDDVYRVVGGELQHKGESPYHRECGYSQEKDKGGKYVLCSSQFTYWGDRCGESGLEMEMELNGKFEGIRNRPNFRGYTIYRDNTFEDMTKKWDWFPKKINCCNIISTQSINGNLIGKEGKCNCRHSN